MKVNQSQRCQGFQLGYFSVVIVDRPDQNDRDKQEKIEAMVSGTSTKFLGNPQVRGDAT